MKRVHKILLAVLLLAVVLGGLAAAWYWAGPWLAQEYIDLKHPDWDVLHVERYDEQRAVVFIVELPERTITEEEINAYLADLAQVARILRLPGYSRVAMLFTGPAESYMMRAEIVGPIVKTDWENSGDLRITPLFLFGARLNKEYISWPDD